MLPRLESFFKREQYLQKIIYWYNETFGGLAGRKNKAYIWHEATSSRKDEYIAYVFYKFLKSKCRKHYYQGRRCTEYKLDTILNDSFAVNSPIVSSRSIQLKYFKLGNKMHGGR